MDEVLTSMLAECKFLVDHAPARPFMVEYKTRWRYPADAVLVDQGRLIVDQIHAWLATVLTGPPGGPYLPNRGCRPRYACQFEPVTNTVTWTFTIGLYRRCGT